MFGTGFDSEHSALLLLDPGKLGIVDLIDGPYSFRILLTINALLIFIRCLIFEPWCLSSSDFVMYH